MRKKQRRKKRKDERCRSGMMGISGGTFLSVEWRTLKKPSHSRKEKASSSTFHLSPLTNHMAPPIHIKLITGFTCSVVITAGLRNLISPGTTLKFLPQDDPFQTHFHASGDVKMAFVFQLLGCFFLTVSMAKVITIFGASESVSVSRKA